MDLSTGCTPCSIANLGEDDESHRDHRFFLGKASLFSEEILQGNAPSMPATIGTKASMAQGELPPLRVA